MGESRRAACSIIKMLVQPLTPRYNSGLIYDIELTLEFYMALTSAATAEIITTHQRKKGDTGSSEVQIALLSARIEYLTEHLKTNNHDFHTRHGLTKLVSQRRRLMTYLKTC